MTTKSEAFQKKINSDEFEARAERAKRARDENFGIPDSQIEEWKKTHPGQLVLVIGGKVMGFYPAISADGHEALRSKIAGLGWWQYRLRYIPYESEETPPRFELRIYIGGEDSPRRTGYFDARFEAEDYARHVLPQLSGAERCRVQIDQIAGLKEELIGIYPEDSE